MALWELEMEGDPIFKAQKNIDWRFMSGEMVLMEDSQALEKILAQATQLLEASCGWLFLIHGSDRSLQCRVSYQAQQSMIGVECAFGEGIVGQVAQTARSMKVEDFSEWEGDQIWDHIQNLDSLIGSPILLEDEIVGVLLVGWDEPHDQFSPDELDVLELFVTQAASSLENARLIQAAEQYVSQIERLNALTQDVLDADQFQKLIEIATKQLCEILHADGCYLVLRDTRLQKYCTLFYAPKKGSNGASASHEKLHAIAMEILNRERANEKEEVFRSLALAPEVAEMYSIRSLLAIPLIKDEQEIGVALALFQDEYTFSKEEQLLLKQISRSLTPALDKLQIFEDERRRRSVLEALRQAGIQLTSKLELDPVLDAILNQALSLVKADDAHIFIFEEGQLSFAAARWADGRSMEPYSMPRKNGITYTVARSGERIVTPNVNQHPLFESMQWGGAIVSLPLRIGDQVVGVMNVAFEQPHDFQEEELSVLELLATQAAVALQNARLFEHINTDRKRVRLLYEVASALVNELDDGKILQHAIDLITRNLEAIEGEAYLLEDDTGRLRIKAGSGVMDITIAELDSLLNAKVGKGIEGWVAENQEPLLVPDVGQDKRWRDRQGIGGGIRSSLCAPIVVGREVLGVLTVLNDSRMNEDQLDLLVAVGKQVGLALSNARKYRQSGRRLAELSALQQVAKVINSRLNMGQLLEEIINQVHQVLGYEIVEIYLVEGDQLVLRAAHGADKHRLERLSLSDGIVGRVARTNVAAFVPEVDKDPDYIAGIPFTKAEIVVPLRKGDIAIGVLNVEAPTRRGLDENDLRLLSSLADQVSVAIENASLYEHLFKQTENLEQTVTKRTVELEHALETARMAERLKTEFVADVSHELRTPLANIRLYIELLSFGNPDRFQEYLTTLTRETDRLVIIIEDLLAISRLDSGTTAPNPKPVDLNALIGSLVNDRQRLLIEKSLHVSLEQEQALPIVMVDEHMITQAMANLLTNAMHYTKPGGSITITTAVQNLDGTDWVTLCVKDTGIGIPPDEQERVFERFYRGAASRLMPVPGTGLGLAICKEILEQHKGRITLKSRVDKGSEFTIWLPIPGQEFTVPS
jgi:signal transduction histidine kinase